MVSGFIAHNINWRWCFWVHAIAVFANAIALLLFFRETRGTVLLSRKAKKLNEWYEAREKAGYYGFDISQDGSSEKQSQRIRWKVKSDEERASILQMIKISLIRPIHMLFTEPVVFFFSLWYVSTRTPPPPPAVTDSAGYLLPGLYSTPCLVLFHIVSLQSFHELGLSGPSTEGHLVTDTRPSVFETVHDFNLQQANAIFAALSIGAVLATILSLYQERIAARFGKHSTTPEGRLYYACVESILLPLGLFWFALHSPSTSYCTMR